MRQEPFDVVDVEQGRLGGVVLRNAVLGFAQTLQLAGERHVAGMAWTTRQNVAFDEAAGQGQVAHNVQQLVAGRLILVLQGGVVEHADFARLHPQFILAGEVRNGLKLIGVVGALGEDDGIVEVAAFDESLFEQGLHFLQENERPAATDVGRELAQVVHAGMLRSQNGAVVIDHDRHAEFICPWAGRPAFRPLLHRGR